jgi:hypothetical protein
MLNNFALDGSSSNWLISDLTTSAPQITAVTPGENPAVVNTPVQISTNFISTPLSTGTILWGDGTQDEDVALNANPFLISHTYTETGNYTIKMAIKNVCGMVSDTITSTIEVVIAPITYYKDEDGDGFGNPNVTTAVSSTTPPDGYVANSDDCDDTQLLYADNDNDGYGSGELVACGAANNTDCNDDNIAIHEPVTYYLDNDSDGHGDVNNPTQDCASTPPTGYVVSSNDCNDNDNTIYPGAPELCDGKDNNCDGTVDNGCALPIVRINDKAQYEGNSGGSAMKFTISLSKKSNATITVAFATQNGTATAGSDYVAKSGTITFNPGQKNKTVSIRIKGDVRVEPDETFRVVLSSPVNATPGKAIGIGTILNDDPATTAVASSAKLPAM